MSIHIRIPKPPSLAEVRKRRRAVVNVNREHNESLSRLERFALFVSEHVGTPGFFILIMLWTICWLSWNSLAPRHVRFDPFPAFVLWLFMSNVIQIFLMPLIMVAQNLQSRHAEMRAENDYNVNVKAEGEVEAILHHLEYQNAILLGIVEKMGYNLEELAHPHPEGPPAT
ncbi:MAG TPA: DUF1003 domain-containing protein [Armatimonadota bacterium]|jgi:uncharacterized membrane protein